MRPSLSRECYESAYGGPKAKFVARRSVLRETVDTISSSLGAAVTGASDAEITGSTVDVAVVLVGRTLGDISSANIVG